MIKKQTIKLKEFLTSIWSHIRARLSIKKIFVIFVILFMVLKPVKIFVMFILAYVILGILWVLDKIVYVFEVIF